MPAEQTVVGGTMAALVAADAIAAQGRPVRLLVPERGVGGGFAAMRRDGRTLELGVRLLELDFEDTESSSPPLDDYVAGTTTARPWARLIGDWVRELAGDGLREIARPEMVLDGRRVDDVLFTVDLSGLAKALGAAEREQMLSEVRAALATNGDDAGVLAPHAADRFADMTLEEASLANHGATFHQRIIAPLCDKVIAGGAAAVCAPLRRKVWAPLFYPRTLAQALNGEPIDFRPARSFHTISPDGCGALVDLLLTRLRARPTASVETAGDLQGVAAADGTVTLSFSDHAPITVRRPILALSADALFAATGIPYAVQRITTAIAWLEVDAPDAASVPELAHVLDPANPVLRVSRGGAGAPSRALLTVELRHDADPETLGTAAHDGLIAAGLLEDGVATDTVMAARRPTFPVPDANTLTAFATAREHFDALGLDVELAGGGLDVTADTLNDQLLQGLRASARTS
jgi:hypothetical protein